MQRKIKRSFGYNLTQVIFYIIIICFLITILIPCLNMVALSFNEGLDSAKGGIWFWPRKFTLENYIAIFQESKLIDGYKVTLARTIIGTLTHVLFSYMSAYCLIYKDLPGRGLVFKLMIFSMMTGVGSVPTYIVYYQYGLINTFWIYILPGLISIGDMVMIRAFLEGISPSLSESAQMDGCNYFKIMYKIYIPLSKPVLAVISLYSAVGHWNDWFTGSFYTSNQDLWPVQTVLHYMMENTIGSNYDATKMDATTGSVTELLRNQPQITSESLKMAAIIFTTLPILCVYPFIQKYFAQGVMVGSLKE